MSFLACSFQKSPAAEKLFDKMGSLQYFRRAWKTKLVDIKKFDKSIYFFFEKPPPYKKNFRREKK